MKIMNAITKRTMKWRTMKWMMGAALAGALALAVPHQAQAQDSFGVGIRVGVVPVGYRSFGPARYEGWNRRVYPFYGGWQPAYVPAWRYHRWDRERFHARYGYRGY